jgi:hypothetical protein
MSSKKEDMRIRKKRSEIQRVTEGGKFLAYPFPHSPLATS